MSTTQSDQPSGRPSKKGNWIALAAAIALAFAVTRACEPEPKPSMEEISSSVSSAATEQPTSSRKPAPSATADKSRRVDAMPWLKGQFGLSPSEALLQDATIWYGYVTGAYVERGNLHVQLQVDRKQDKAMGKQAAKALANFVMFSDDPLVSDVDFAIAEDGAGTFIDQEKVKRM